MNAAQDQDWRNRDDYAPLLFADRSLIAWEWLRRDCRYRHAAEHGGDSSAFGLVEFEPPERRVPDARPIWTFNAHPLVLRVRRSDKLPVNERFDLTRTSACARLVETPRADHLLISDGLRAVRLDGPRQVFAAGAVGLAYRLEGRAMCGPPLLTLRRFLAVCQLGHFSRTLHPREPRAARWVLMLRAWDALIRGANQRDIAQALLSRSAGQPQWRGREPSTRSRTQRLVRAARRMVEGGYLDLLK